MLTRTCAGATDEHANTRAATSKGTVHNRDMWISSAATGSGSGQVVRRDGAPRQAGRAEDGNRTKRGANATVALEHTIRQAHSRYVQVPRVVNGRRSVLLHRLSCTGLSTDRRDLRVARPVQAPTTSRRHGTVSRQAPVSAERRPLGSRSTTAARDVAGRVTFSGYDHVLAGRPHGSFGGHALVPAAQCWPPRSSTSRARRRSAPASCRGSRRSHRIACRAPRGTRSTRPR